MKKYAKVGIFKRNKHKTLVNLLNQENEDLRNELGFYVNYYFENNEKWNFFIQLLKTFNSYENIDDFFSEIIEKTAKFINNEKICLVLYGDNGQKNKIFTTDVKSTFIELHQKYFENADDEDVEAKLQEIFKDDYTLEEIYSEDTKYGYMFICNLNKRRGKDDFYNLKSLCEYIAVVSRHYENKASLKFDSISKVQFLVNFSHEIRTPLNGIITYTELLKNKIKEQEGDLGQETKNYIENINISARQLNYLMVDITESAKVQYAHVKINKEMFSTNVEILNILSVFHFKLLEKSIDVEQILTDVEINSDVMKFNQILYNLISNAIKFSPVGGKIKLMSWAEKGKFNFEITDEGSGIPEVERDKIFKFLSQTSSGSKKGGSGVGLAVVKKIIEIQGGQIGYESKPNVGTTFWFELPLDCF